MCRKIEKVFKLLKNSNDLLRQREEAKPKQTIENLKE